MATRNAQQRRQDAKADFDAFMAECPSRKLLDRVSDKWVTLVLCSLADGPLRFSEVSRKLAGVSQKMLTQTLRTLERDGLVTREVTASVPVRVDYDLTDLGRSLLAPLALMKAWAEQHMAQVQVAQEDYDRGQAVSA